MKGKYKRWSQFCSAYAFRQWIRLRLRGAVSWPESQPLRDGCTAVIGMCHRLPDVLVGNLKCLDANAWPELREVVVVVDGERGCLPANTEALAHQACRNLAIRFVYYSAHQAAITERLRLPYAYSWLSWTIGIGLSTTRTVLIHDYDALVLDDALARRYERFLATGSAMQGIRWYEGNGVEPEDRLATTFEAFVDVPWVTGFAPIQLFNQIAYVGGRSVDFDSLLDVQCRKTPLARRTIEPMDEASLVHPSQMIHQYTMFRRCPGKAQPCFSIPMIPFFEWFSGKPDAIARATERLRGRSGKVVDLFGDGVRVNLELLRTEQVDWALKQITRVCTVRGLPPDPQVYAYGVELYGVADAPSDRVWVGDFTAEQRDWIDRSSGRVR